MAMMENKGKSRASRFLTFKAFVKNPLPSMASFVKIVALRQPANSQADWDRVARRLRQAIAQERVGEIRALMRRHGPAVAQLDFAPEVVDRGLRGLSWPGRAVKACEKKEFVAGLEIFWPHADKEARNGAERTALLDALDDGHLASARVMLEGSDLLARDSQGKGVIAHLFNQMDRVTAFETLNEPLTRDALMMVFTVLERAEKLPFAQSHEIFASALRNGKIALCGNEDGYGRLSEPTQEKMKSLGFWQALESRGPKHADVAALLKEFGGAQQPEPIQEVFAQWEAWLIRREVDRVSNKDAKNRSANVTPERAAENSLNAEPVDKNEVDSRLASQAGARAKSKRL